MQDTKITFDEFIDVISEAYALDIDDTLLFGHLEEEQEDDGTTAFYIYTEDGHYRFTREENPDGIGKTEYGYRANCQQEFQDEPSEIQIRPLKMI